MTGSVVTFGWQSYTQHVNSQLGTRNPRPVHVRSRRGSLGIASDNPCLPEDWAWRRLPRANLIAEANERNERNERLRPATCSGRGVTAVTCSLAGLGVVWVWSGRGTSASHLDPSAWLAYEGIGRDCSAAASHHGGSGICDHKGVAVVGFGRHTSCAEFWERRAAVRHPFPRSANTFYLPPYAVNLRLPTKPSQAKLRTVVEPEGIWQR